MAVSRRQCCRLCICKPELNYRRTYLGADEHHPFPEVGALERDAPVEGAHREGHRHARLCFCVWVCFCCSLVGGEREGAWGRGSRAEVFSCVIVALTRQPHNQNPTHKPHKTYLGLLHRVALALDGAHRQGQEPARAVRPEEERLVGDDVAAQDGPAHHHAHALDLCW